MGLPPKLTHFIQALKSCEKATERNLSSSNERSGYFEGVEPSIEREDGAGGEGQHGRQRWKDEVAFAMEAVPEIFRRIREADLSPDDTCYSTAARCFGRGS